MGRGFYLPPSIETAEGVRGVLSEYRRAGFPWLAFTGWPGGLLVVARLVVALVAGGSLVVALVVAVVGPGGLSAGWVVAWSLCGWVWNRSCASVGPRGLFPWLALG